MISDSRIAQRLLQISLNGKVTRWHTEAGQLNEVQTIAQHSFNMVFILHAITPETLLDYNLVMACLQHDMAERVTSDISKVAKIHLGVENKLKELENRVIKEMGLLDISISSLKKEYLDAADMIELQLHLTDELLKGNDYAKIFIDRVKKIRRKAYHLNGRTKKIFDELDSALTDKEGFLRRLQEIDFWQSIKSVELQGDAVPSG